MTPAIDARQLARRFGDQQAVAGVDLSIAAGEIYGFLGPNGAGKSTTVRMLTTLLAPTGGSARVAGFDVHREADRVRLAIGVALQEAALDGKQTGRELLDLQGRLYGLSKVERSRRVAELLELVDIGDAIDRRINTYSGGMKRRLDLAAALVHQPQVLFLDEPTTGLDPRSRRDAWALVSSLALQGVTVLLTTQYLEEADILSDSIVVIDHGKVIASGTAEDLKRRVGINYCQVTPADPADLPQLGAALAGLNEIDIDADTNSVSVRAPDGVATLAEVFRRVNVLGIELVDISLRKPSLDEAFLHLTERTAAPS